MSMIQKVFVFIMLFSLCSVAMAKNDDYYKTIIRILTYSDLSPSARICVFNDNAIAQSFQQYVLKSQKSHYAVVGVNSANFKATSCQVVYFSRLSAKEENQLIRSYPKQKLLSISDNNQQCEIGSAICLSTRQDKPIAVAVNLDALARSQVKIDYQILRMWVK